MGSMCLLLDWPSLVLNWVTQFSKSPPAFYGSLQTVTRSFVLRRPYRPGGCSWWTKQGRHLFTILRMSEIEENGDDGSGVRISDFPDPIGTKTIYDYLVVCGGRGVSVLSRAVSRVIKSNPCPNTFFSTFILWKEELNTVRTAKWAYSRIAGSMYSPVAYTGSFLFGKTNLYHCRSDAACW